MKKQTVVILWAVAVLLAVGGCFGVYLSGRLKEKNDSLSANEVFECMSADIVRYSVKKSDGEYTLVKNNGVWTIEDNSVALIDAEKAEELIKYASRITANSTLKKNELEGFDKTGIGEAKIGLADGSEHTVSFIGSKSDVCAFQVSGDDNVYSTYITARDALLPGSDALRIADVFSDTGGLEKTLTAYEYKNADGVVMSVRTKQGAEITGDGKNRFIMTKPYTREVDDELFEQQIIIKIPAVKAAKFVNDFPESLEIYGLDEAQRSEMSFEREDGKETLYIGRNDGGLIYAMLKDRGGVFAVNSSLLDFLHTEPFYIIEKALLSMESSNINRIVLKSKDAVYEIAKKSDGEKSLYYINGKDMSQAVYDDIVAEICKISVISDVKAELADMREITVEVYYSDGRESVEVSLSPSGDKSYAAFINGEKGFSVDKESVDGLMKKIDDADKSPIKLN